MIHIYENPEEKAQAAARMIVRLARDAIEAKGNFRLALAGGGTPLPTYRLLAEPPLREQMPWKSTDVFWGDERCAPMDSPLSNAGRAYDALLDSTPLPHDQIHPILCGGISSPEQAAEQYELLLKGFFPGSKPGLDLVLLGLGEDGHTASLFPQSPAIETRRWVDVVYGGDPEMWRVTLTPAFLNRSKTIIFLVQGVEKADVVLRVLQGPHQPESLPAQAISPSTGEVLWLLDSYAANRLDVQKLGKP